jgi:Ca-activated chloride channel family protein
MDKRSGFTLTVFQQKYLHPGDDEIQAMIRVTATPGDEPGDEGSGAGTGGAAEVIIVDCSGSMARPRPKLLAARRAASAALDAMRDGTEFAVLSGRYDADMVYPRGITLARATPETRAEAKAAVERLDADGRTQISSWLAMAARLLRPHQGLIRHTMLFTDGKNQHESRDGTLDRVLSACRGMFTCDARGIGDEWEPSDLLKIASVLHGRADGLPDVADLEHDFRATMHEAMRKVVPDVGLRIRPVPCVTVLELRQLHPADADLTEQGESADATATRYWIGSWSGETRDYLVRLAAPADGFPRQADVPLARVDVTVRGADGGHQPVLAEPGFVCAHWTLDPPMRTWLPTDSYANQRETGHAITAGCHAWRAGQYGKAEEAWGTAVRLATETGDEDRLSLLVPLVEVLDLVTGKVRLRDGISRADVLRAEVGSSATIFVPTAEAIAPPRPPLPRPSAQPPRPERQPACPRCDRISPAGARRCEQCGLPRGADGAGAWAEADE